MDVRLWSGDAPTIYVTLPDHTEIYMTTSRNKRWRVYVQNEGFILDTGTGKLRLYRRWNKSMDLSLQSASGSIECNWKVSNRFGSRLMRDVQSIFNVNGVDHTVLQEKDSTGTGIVVVHSYAVSQK
jgi:hypothetical protein